MVFLGYQITLLLSLFLHYYNISVYDNQNSAFHKYTGKVNHMLVLTKSTETIQSSRYVNFGFLSFLSFLYGAGDQVCSLVHARPAISHQATI